MGDMMDDMLGKVTSNLDIFKKIAGKIPGFSGYVERQTRRDADKLVRETLSNRFRELEGQVSALQRDFISQGEIGYIDDLEAAAIKLRTFADRIRTASRGYSGMFDAVKINEDELAKIYNYDASMVDLVDEVARAIENVAASVGSDGLNASIRNLESKTQECIDIFNRRDEIILSTGTTE